MYLQEGIKPLRDALAAGASVETIFICGSKSGQLEEIDEGRTIILADELFDELSDTENSQGVIAVLSKDRPGAEEFCSGACKGNILLLDRLQDPGNVGTMIRTAEAAGITGIIALKGTADIYSPKVVRSAAGTLLRMPIIESLDEEEALDMIGRGGWKLAVSTADGGADCFEERYESPVCLAIGNEGSGVSESLINRADIRLMIPMEGEIESLNAAIAAGIMMYQMRRNSCGEEDAGKTQ